MSIKDVEKTFVIIIETNNATDLDNLSIRLDNLSDLHICVSTLRFRCSTIKFNMLKNTDRIYQFNEYM